MIECEIVEFCGNQRFEHIEWFKALNYDDANVHLNWYKRNKMPYPDSVNKSIYWRIAQRHRVLHIDGTATVFDGNNVFGFDSDYEYGLFEFIEWYARLKKELKKVRGGKYARKPNSEKYEYGKFEYNLVRGISRIRHLSKSRFLVKSVAKFIRLKDWLHWHLIDFWFNLYSNLKFKIGRFHTIHTKGHFPEEIWGVSEHILADIRYNLDKIVELSKSKDVCMGIPMIFIKEAWEKNHPDEVWDCSETEDDVDGGAVRMREVYSEMIHKIDLISHYGHLDVKGCREFPKDSDEVKSLIVNGTYDMEDYKKSNELFNKEWKEFWDLFLKYGFSIAL